MKHQVFSLFWCLLLVCLHHLVFAQTLDFVKDEVGYLSLQEEHILEVKLSIYQQNTKSLIIDL